MTIFLAASSAVGQTEVKPAASAGAPLPTADEVVDKYANAIGGKEAFEKLTPEQQAKVLQAEAKRKTPEARAERARVAEAVQAARAST